MKKIYIFLFILATIKISAQCVPINNSNPGLYPTALASGCQNAPYSDTISAVAPNDTVIFGFTVNVDSIAITGVSNLPAGLNYACTPSNCKTSNPLNGNPLTLCMLISGTPTALTGPNDSVAVTVTMWVTIPFIGLQVYTTTYKTAINISICTGINNSFANGIKLYPNPASNMLAIDFLATPATPVNFVLMNTLGQVVLNSKLTDIHNKLDVSSIAAGVYVYQIENETGIHFNKLVINK